MLGQFVGYRNIYSAILPFQLQNFKLRSNVVVKGGVRATLELEKNFGATFQQVRKLAWYRREDKAFGG